MSVTQCAEISHQLTSVSVTQYRPILTPRARRPASLGDGVSFPQRHVDLDSDGLLGRQRWQEQLLSDDASDSDDAGTSLVFSGHAADIGAARVTAGNGVPGTADGRTDGWCLLYP